MITGLIIGSAVGAIAIWVVPTLIAAGLMVRRAERLECVSVDSDELTDEQAESVKWALLGELAEYAKAGGDVKAVCAYEAIRHPSGAVRVKLVTRDSIADEVEDVLRGRLR